MVDVARHRLLNTDSFTSVPLCISNIEENIILLSPDDSYSDVLKDFNHVFKPEQSLSPGTAAQHGVQHYIKTTGLPVHSRYRRLRPELSQIAKEAFAEMEKMSVCSKSASPWASPLHMTPKKDGTWRPCGDYRRLSIITKPDHYVMPNISDLTSSISTARIFSKLDLPKGYFQVQANPGDVPKTAITTPFGIRHVRVPLLDIWLAQQWNNLPEDDGLNIRTSSFLPSVHQRHLRYFRKPQGRQRTPSGCIRSITQQWSCYSERQVHFRCTNHRIPRS